MKWLCICFTLTLAGCASLQNLTANDIRKDEYLRRTEHIPVTISQANNAIGTYSIRCRPYPKFVVNPENDKQATITFSMPGLSRSSVIAVIDANEYQDQTEITGYAYYSTYTKFIDRLVEIMQQPSNCDTSS